MDTNKMDTNYIYELVKETPNDLLVGWKNQSLHMYEVEEAR